MALVIRIIMRTLKAFSGFAGLLLGLPRHRGQRLRQPHDLTPRQAAAKAKIDAALDAGASVDVWLPQQGGSTRLAHVVHSERGGVVVARSSEEARRFADDHMRMFGKGRRLRPAKQRRPRQDGSGHHR